jgi:predicted MFS family arabinose efflux permease
VRAAGVAVLLWLPPTTVVMLGFAAAMGLSYMAVLPPISQLLSQHFGNEGLGTLMGVVMLVHQVGSFAGIGLGGWAAARSGGDRLSWCVDIVLAPLAVALVLRSAGASRHTLAAGRA